VEDSDIHVIRVFDLVDRNEMHPPGVRVPDTPDGVRLEFTQDVSGRHEALPAKVKCGADHILERRRTASSFVRANSADGVNAFEYLHTWI